MVLYSFNKRKITYSNGNVEEGEWENNKFEGKKSICNGNFINIILKNGLELRKRKRKPDTQTKSNKIKKQKQK